MPDHHGGAAQDVFDIGNWLERAGRRPEAPAHSEPATPAAVETYVPRHRADVAADSVA